MDGNGKRFDETPSQPGRSRKAELEARVAFLEQELAAAEARNAALRARWEAWISLVSHDLRTPLTLILGHAENLQSRLAKGTEAERDRRGLGSIVVAARRLNKMLNQVVDGARLEIDSLVSQPREINLHALVDDEVRRFRRVNPGLRIHVDVPATLPYAYGDSRRVAAIVATLISNAAIFSPNGGDIRVTGTALDDAIAITVCDTGIGVAPDELPRLFERFYRPDRARQLPREGLGISLAISRDVARSFGGDLTVESAGVDHGSCFTLRLPLAPDLPEE